MSNIARISDVNQKVKIYQFDLFKGEADSSGKIIRTKKVGETFIRDGLKTYTVHLKALLGQTYYLLANNKQKDATADFVILTREPAKNLDRKYFWNDVGRGYILDETNHGLMRLSWDILISDLYMQLHPTKVTELEEVVQREAA